MSESSPLTACQGFYEHQYRNSRYADGVNPDVLRLLNAFVDAHQLRRKRVLEVGCGRGAYQDVVADWTGVDVADSVRPFLHKPFFCAPAERLPFADESFDAVWSVHVLEHVPDLEAGLGEIARVVRPGGVALLKPAWFCRPWAADGYQVRPWSDFDWRGRLIKASIPLRNALWFRLPGVLCRRLAREVVDAIRPVPAGLRHGRLRPNYDVYWQADSDACNSIDPHDLVRWFASRGWRAVGHESLPRRLLVRGGALVFEKLQRLQRPDR